jgi:hypothetical protein
MNNPERSPAAPKIRPPDFLLPNSEQSAARKRAGEPDIYLSWGGQIYGPAGADEVIAGVRSSWFEPDTLYWFEGQTDWRPVGEYPGLSGDLFKEPHAETANAEAPSETAHEENRELNSRRRRKGKSVAPRAPSGHAMKKNSRWIILAFSLLAIALTAGLILLLMMA